MIRLSVTESTPGELDTPEGAEQLERAIDALRGSLVKASGQPDGSVRALRELEDLMVATYARESDALGMRLIKVIRGKA